MKLQQTGETAGLHPNICCLICSFTSSVQTIIKVFSTETAVWSQKLKLKTTIWKIKAQQSGDKSLETRTFHTAALTKHRETLSLMDLAMKNSLLMRSDTRYCGLTCRQMNSGWTPCSGTTTHHESSSTVSCNLQPPAESPPELKQGHFIRELEVKRSII